MTLGHHLKNNSSIILASIILLMLILTRTQKKREPMDNVFINLVTKKAKIFNSWSLNGSNVPIRTVNEATFHELSKLYRAEKIKIHPHNKSAYELDNGAIVLKFFNYEENNYFIFFSQKELETFMNEEIAEYVTCGVRENIFICCYTLRPRFVMDLFSKSIYKKTLLKKVQSETYELYKVEGFEGVFLIINTPNKNGGFWYPNMEMFEIDQTFQAQSFR